MNGLYASATDTIPKGAAFFGFRMWLELHSGDPSILLPVEAVALYLCMRSAYLHNRFEVKRSPLRIVHRAWRQTS